MLIIPAIDLKEGRCVRLRQGRMEDADVFSDDPLAVAARWVAAGARRLHLVDLDGAFAGSPVNAVVIKQISQRWPELPIQIGGGIRTIQHIQAYLDAGVNYVIIGTKAVTDPEFVIQACQQYSGKIMIGIDAKDGFVATEGWARVSDQTAIALAKKFEQQGVSAIIYTDISRDGMMQGVNVEATKKLAEALTIPVIASGGVSQLADIHALGAVAACGITGAIVGRALYEGALDLAQAQACGDLFSTALAQ